MLAELLGAAALAGYPPPWVQGLRLGADPVRRALPIPPELQRPLRLPSLTAGTPCPVSEQHRVSSGFGPALGSGPVYPVGEPTLRYVFGRQFPRPWSANPGHAWREFPSYTRVRRPGCYAYQIDGTTFSRVVVFRAAP